MITSINAWTGKVCAILCLLLLWGIIAIPIRAVAQDVDWPEQTPAVIDINREAELLDQAYLKALESLPRFLARIDNPPSDWSDISVKVEFPVTKDHSEFMWVAFFERKDGVYKGLLANKPKYIKYASFGDSVEFNESQIFDWQYSKNGKLYGHYTTRALLFEMSPKERNQLETILNETPE